MTPRKVCIIGGGATGAAILWCLGQQPQADTYWDVTLFHSDASLGGHSFTKDVPWHGKTYPVEFGVQLVAPMVYANLALQLSLPAFQQKVPMTEFDELRIACSYPDLAGIPQNWGNFPAYQSGPLFQMYDANMVGDSKTFQFFMETALVRGWLNKTMQQYFDSHTDKYVNQPQWVHWFLWPYLSIINGYGAALMGQMTAADLIPFFATLPIFSTPLGSFTQPGKGWQRFTNGAATWVQAMSDLVQPNLKQKINYNCTVTAVTTNASAGNTVTVTWTDGNGHTPAPQTFDKVFMTTDMNTNATLLNNPANQYYWDLIYKNHIATDMWPLMDGVCYIHSDPSVLSPHLVPLQQETLQFTAYYAPQQAFPFYDMFKTYTTYLQANLLNDPGAAGLYNTMYGYVPDPKVDKVPDPSKVIYSNQTKPWKHSRFAPSYMPEGKKNLYKAQPPGAKHSYPGQQPTNVYFAGNNTTYDSEEGALLAAMIITNYAFGLPYPIANIETHGAKDDTLKAIAIAMYDIYLNEVMFPISSTASRTAALAVDILRQILPHVKL